MITEQQINDIKSRAYLPDIVSENVTLHRSGTGFVGCCPFHNERTPSFHVFAPDSQHPYWHYHCFGCGKNGDVIQYLMERDSSSFNDAATSLAERLCVNITNEKPSFHYRHRYQPKKEVRTSPKDPCYLDLYKTDKNGNIVSVVNEVMSDKSDFCQWLLTVFTPEQVKKAVNDYYLGTTKDNHVIFWRIDIKNLVHSGKIMMYGADGHRIRNGEKDVTDWIHGRYRTALKKSGNANERIKNIFRQVGKSDPIPAIKWDDSQHRWINDCWQLNQTLFGEHLLRNEPKDKGVCIVESEKTAVVMSILKPQFIWLSCGGADMLENALVNSHDALLGRRCLLFPDKAKGEDNFFEKWKGICEGKDKRHIGFPDLNLTVSDALEHDTELKPGDDIADLYLSNLSKGNVEPQTEPQQPTNTAAAQQDKTVTLIQGRGLEVETTNTDDEGDDEPFLGEDDGKVDVPVYDENLNVVGSERCAESEFYDGKLIKHLYFDENGVAKIKTLAVTDRPLKQFQK